MALTIDLGGLASEMEGRDRDADAGIGPAASSGPEEWRARDVPAVTIEPTSGAPTRPVHRALHALLGVPLFYKLLIANAAIVTVGAIVGTFVAARHERATPDAPLLEIVAILAVVGVAASVAVNAAILRIALAPVRQLEETASRVHDGHLEARAPVSLLADRKLRSLLSTFNGMLDRLALYRSRVRGMAARVLKVAEEERRRIAKDLHDDTAQTLAALLVRVRLAQGVKDAELRDALLDEIRQAIADAMERVRFSARGLRPPALDALGLVAALEAHVRSITDATGIDIEFHTGPLEGTLSPDAELALYRIVQEALANVIRHSRATCVQVTLRVTSGQVIAKIQDNGRGFAVEHTLAQTKGFGLFGMRERTEYLGGRLEICSQPGEGTCIEVSIPRTASVEERHA
ncbi:MAG: sensor histidine kinase [Gemmatimonadetes bacterium]|nr:sensor histidine kinase [Gemmatimonadota bacterium]